VSDGEEKQIPGETVPPAGRRPNAAYRLSRETAREEEPVYYYSRDRRLAKAPQAVRDLYREEAPPRFNLLRPLIGSKPRAMLFGCIALICVTMLVLSIFGYTGGAYSLAGNSISVQARQYDGAVLVTLKKSPAKGGLLGGSEPYSGAVDVAVSPAARAGETPSVFFHRIFFSLESAEEYRFSVPFDSGELLMVLQTEKNTLSLKVKPE
jgi:hypothetical protein